MVEVMKKVSEKYEENVKAVRKVFPKALVLDVTLEGAMGKLDPVFPLGKIEVPGMRRKALSVMGMWEGLKVFKKVVRGNEVVVEENLDWMGDERKLGKVRGCKCWGEFVGLKIGDEMVEVEDGKKIVREVYKGLIEERFGKMLEGIKREAEKRTVVLLDYKEEKIRPFNHVEVLKEILIA